MYKYKCSKCSKSFRDSWNLARHQNRKVQCVSINEGSINLGSIEDQTRIKQGSFRDHSRIILGSSNLLSHYNNPINSYNNDNSSKFQSSMICIYCNRTFKHNTNCYRHMKYTCKKKKECLEENKELKDIGKLERNARKKELEYKINKTTINNNNITNNNSNNIQVNNNNYININPLGQEDLSFLTQEKMISLINERYNAFNAIQRLLGDNPSNINYYQKDNKYIKYVNEEHQFVHGHIKDIMEQQVCYGIDKIIDMYELIKDKLTRKQRKHYEKMINESLNGDINKKYNDELGLIMLDNRDTNKKLLETDKPLTDAINVSIPSGDNKGDQNKHDTISV